MIQVVFHPSALHRITGLSARELHNRYVDAEAVLGRKVRRITEAIRDAGAYGEMIGIVDAFIAGLAALRKPPRDIDAALRRLRHDPSVGVERLAASCALSLRQMERNCRERTGLGPKAFAQPSRFDRAACARSQLSVRGE